MTATYRGTAPAPARAATRLAAALLAALALTATVACQQEPREPRVVVETRFLERLSQAIDDVNRARGLVVRDANAVSAAAKALDDVDAAAVTGDRETARGRRAAAGAAFAKGLTAVHRLGKDVAAYRKAVLGLQHAPREGLDAAQAAALDDVGTAAGTELGRLRDYATVLAVVWSRYERLDEAQRLWVTRSNGGWYRDQREAAGAYLVLVDRAELARARSSLAGADRRRLAAAKAVDTEMATARGALASLLG